MNKIVVHNGIFHADDVFCVAMAQYFFDVSYERVHKPSEQDLNDPDVAVVDVGGVYDPSKNNFDHHQSSALPAACVLLAEKLIDNRSIFKMLCKFLLTPISEVDCGHKKDDFGGINSIIRSFNNIENGFDIAVQVALDIFDAYYQTAKVVTFDTARWKKCEVPFPGIKVLRSESPILSWRELAEKDNVKFLICESNREKGSWNVISRDSTQFVIKEDKEQTFRHNSGFMAVYNTYYKALKAATDNL